MNDTVLECQGLPCPQPVLKCKRCIEEHAPQRLVVIVDNEAAKENVARFLANKGYETHIDKDGSQWRVIGVLKETGLTGSQENDSIRPTPETGRKDQRTVVFITSECLGVGADGLGSKLMYNFLGTLPELGSALWRVVLVNGGVKLATYSHPCLEKLQVLAEGGVEILVCGTCLDHFDLMDRKEIGQTTNMLDVVTTLHLADKIINI